MTSDSDSLYESLVTRYRDISGTVWIRWIQKKPDIPITSLGFIVESQTVQNNLSMHALVSSRCYNCSDRRWDEVGGGEFACPSDTHLNNSNIFSLSLSLSRARARSISLSHTHTQTHTWFHIPPER